LTVFKALSQGQKGDAVAAEFGLSRNSVYVYKKRVLAALPQEIAYLPRGEGSGMGQHGGIVACGNEN
jgi:hypothetical protein